MSYIDTLNEIKNNIETGKAVQANQKLIIIDLIEKERHKAMAGDDPFHYLYTDITATEDIFDFKNQLDEQYEDAQRHAECCIQIFPTFSHLTANESLLNWLSSAIKMVNFIAIHYLQDVLNEKPIRRSNVGPERSLYIQINRREVKAEKAGRIMIDLYDERNSMEHTMRTDKANPGRIVFHPPKYSKILKKVNKRFPEALRTFNTVYKDHYAS